MLEVVITQWDSRPPSKPNVRRSTPLTDEDALQILRRANTPKGRWDQRMNGSCFPTNHGCMSTRPGTNMSRSVASSRGRRSRFTNGKLKEDEETLRTRRFWQNWAAKATEELLSQVKETAQPVELVYTGKCGPEPRFSMSRCPSTESLNTDLSLLACSDLNAEVSTRRTRHKKKKRGKSKVAPKTGPNWEMFAKERKGMLDRFMQADASRLEGYMKGSSAPMQNVVQQSKATDIMSRQEKNLLKRCAYMRGLNLAGQNKSYSTENLMPTGPKLPKADTRISRPITGLSGSSEPVSSITVEPRVDYQGYQKQEEDLRSVFNKTGRTPSPQSIKKMIPPRPHSAIPTSRQDPKAADQYGLAQKYIPSKGGIFQESYGDISASPASPTCMVRDRKHSTVLGLPEIESTFSNKVRHRIKKTLKELSKATGYGDSNDVCTVIEDETGLYTEADYAKHPRYPQNVRIVPSLSQVIKEDIRDRMGRPRRHEVRLSDVQAFDIDQPPLGRFHRNLLIFNWLNATHECQYEVNDVPAIVDLEGRPPPRNYPQFVPGICGQSGNVSSAFSSCLPHTGPNDQSSSASTQSDFNSDDSFFD